MAYYLPMPDKATQSQRALDTFRRGHIGRLFAEMHRDFSLRVREHFDAAGYPNVNNSHIQVFTSLPLEGARITTLAERAGITKQSMGARVDELIALGYLERVTDGNDGRAAPVRFSAKGRRLFDKARSGVDAIDAHYASLIGKARYRQLRESLRALVDALDLDIPA